MTRGLGAGWLARGSHVTGQYEVEPGFNRKMTDVQLGGIEMGRDREIETQQKEREEEKQREGERHRGREASFPGLLRGAATYQFLPEPGYSLVDTFKAFQLAGGLGPSVLGATPVRWGMPPGLSPRG